VLDEFGVKATFFVVSAWAEQYPDTAQAIVAHGHELMNHSAKHDHYNALTADQIVADVNRCNDAIEAISGVRPSLIRCPFGEYDDHVIAAIRSIGMEPIQWDVEASRAASSAAEKRGSAQLPLSCFTVSIFNRRFGPPPSPSPEHKTRSRSDRSS